MENPFNDRGVSVTRNALSSAGQVFPLREILNVRVVTVQKNKVLPITISVIGVVGAIVGGVFLSSAGIVCGVMLAVVGWLTWSTQDVTQRRTRSAVEHRSRVCRTRSAGSAQDHGRRACSGPGSGAASLNGRACALKRTALARFGVNTKLT
jgi:hypothetical protein